ncbi:o-succinylbenzoate synthase [Flagellimonas allohymeniacidonis]|uniref:O-succinylbenzoate synthase n=1 Tax=Flagellimonas allohymeniacidonis TaxID=2517819 RepID=A0A4V2HSQ2_9FLAO|nr:o-succinylbenzoate synthase [Allomuricauda hymeniacidonis]TAI48650.1 o-succinylbenzoate synthase [Allomuricauda hymeniacidonis]
MKATYKRHLLNFKTPSGTSRGVMTEKETWFLVLSHDGSYGIGECGLLRGLSIDDVEGYEAKLAWVCKNVDLGLEKLWEELTEFPSIQFGLEQAFISLQSTDSFELFPSAFTKSDIPIAINGLIWMGDKEFMLSQLEQKLEEGFHCIKMKIGAIDFKSELSILRSIREKFSPSEIELRVDANGAFSASEALDKLKVLAKFDIHSIEQPIKAGQWEAMQRLCAETPLPIALDEELIGISDVTKKEELLQTVRPQYIILKPSLIGGFRKSKEWIDLANKYRIGWWITSALESNIGLNAIAQWTFSLQTKMPQGLGTGSLFTNNFESPLEVSEGNLFYKQNKNWQKNLIHNLCI